MKKIGLNDYLENEYTDVISRTMAMNQKRMR